METDILTPFLLPKAGIRGGILTLKETLENIITRHAYPLSVNDILGEMILGGVCFSSLFKHMGIFTLHSTTDGPIRSVVIDVTSQGTVRALATFNSEEIINLAMGQKRFTDMMGSGYLTLTLDELHGSLDRYQGIVELQGKGFCDSFIHYFKQSEQIDTYMAVILNHDSGIISEGSAIFLQKLPSDTDEQQNEDNWNDYIAIADTLSKEEIFDKKLSHEDLIRRLFWQDEPEIYKKKEYQFGCRCSRNKLLKAFDQLDKQEISDLVNEKGEINVNCDFCNEHYSFRPFQEEN